MAGWILYNKGLDKRPQIVRTMSACSLDRWRAVGAWLTLWEWADDVTEDGFVPHVTPADVDTIVGVPGFFAVGVEVGWLAQVTGGIRLVDFTEYNTDSAKKRAKDAKRKARVRNVSADSRTERGQMSATSRTERGATEHNSTDTKESQDKTHVDADASTPVCQPPKPEFSNRVERIYEACTWRKEKPREAKKAIVKAGKRVAARYLGDADKAFEFLMARVLAYAKSPYVQTTDRQYLPLPASWFNADRFDDPDDAWNQTRKETTNGTVNRSGRRADGTGTRPGEYEEPRLALRVLNED